MPRGYRCVLAAVCGWLILATSPPNPSVERKQADAQQASEQTLNRIATAIEKANEPSERDEGCRNRKDDRSSDLCAQWKAADAAADSAHWTARTFWLSVVALVVGALTLIAAAFAAWFAKSASTAARDALALDRGIAASQLRPYLFIDQMEVEEEMPHQYQITIWFKNFGSIPARDILVRSFCYLGGDVINLAEFDHKQRYVNAGVAAPGHQRRTFEHFVLTADDYHRLANSLWHIILRVEYSYSDGADSSFDESVDYFTTGRGLDKRIFFLLTDSTRDREAERRDYMRETRVSRKLWRSRSRAQRRQN